MPKAIRLAVLVALWPALALGDDAQAARGLALFAARCASCHGQDATGGAGGDIRGMGAAALRRAIRGFEQMPRIDLGEGDLAAVAAHLARLEGG